MSLPAATPGANVSARHVPSRLGGIMVIQGAGCSIADRGRDGVLCCRHDPPQLQARTLTAVPCPAWADRGNGQMGAWLREVIDEPVTTLKEDGG